MFCVGPISLMSEELLKHHGSFDKEISFESYGVRIRIASDSQDLIDEAIRAVSAGFGDKTSFTDDVGSQGSGHDFVVTFDGDHYLLFRNGEQVSYAKSKKIFFKNLNGRLRIEAAEYAKSKVFLHAGVVGWKGSAIVVPAKSFEGKSTLTAELVKNGAEYYSDEYAVIDELGNVHPFPRKISMRYFGAYPREGSFCRRDRRQAGRYPLTSWNGSAYWIQEGRRLGSRSAWCGQRDHGDHPAYHSDNARSKVFAESIGFSRPGMQ